MDSQVEAVNQYIQSNWINTIRQPEQQSPAEIRLPRPFSVPTAGATFHLFFYWDTFFINEGLLRSDQAGMARNNLENLLYLIETYGFVPNYALLSDIYRSQPPVVSVAAANYYTRTHDLVFLNQAYPALEKDYAFWMTNRVGPHGLNHYGWHGYPKDIDSFYWAIQQRLKDIPENPIERYAFQAHALAEAESGWDFTPRFDRHCAHFYAVDLNSLLFLHETNMAYFCDQLSLPGSETWRKRALARRNLMNKLCWDDDHGFYYDFDFVKNQPSQLETAAAFFALWAGLPNQEQAERMAGNLKMLEKDYGLVACRPGPKKSNQLYQWDFPNAWPPLQYAAIAGLQRYGFHELARRLASKFLACVTRNFMETGNLWEKYNAVTGGVDVQDEYPMPPMLGWTAATYLFALEILGN